VKAGCSSEPLVPSTGLHGISFHTTSLTIRFFENFDTNNIVYMFALQFMMKRVESFREMSNVHIEVLSTFFYVTNWKVAGSRPDDVNDFYPFT
jgi:hypothetical protein